MDNVTLKELLERLVRIETRLTRLLIHLGLDPHGSSPSKEN